jgi:hypothetical protein
MPAALHRIWAQVALLLRKDRGQTLGEHGLLITVIAIVVMVAFNLGTSISQMRFARVVHYF